MEKLARKNKMVEDALLTIRLFDYSRGEAISYTECNQIVNMAVESSGMAFEEIQALYNERYAD